MALIKCPECGHEVSETALNCPNCGYSFEKKKFCKHCGEKIPEDSVVCPKCGRQVEQTEKNGGIVINNANTSSASSSSSSSASATAQNVNTNEERRLKRIDKMTALMLCIFLGYFGVHKFYEGKIGMGLLYLFTFGLFGIGWIVDIVIIATKPDPYYV